MQSFITVCYKVFEWMVRFAFLNILWFVFSIVGLVLFGIFPATTAMFSIVRKWVIGKRDFSIFNTFWHFYKSDFIKSNFIGFFILLGGFILFVDYQYLLTLEGSLFILMTCAFISVLLLYFVIVLYIFPVFAHYKLRFFHYFKYAIIIGVSYPMRTIFMIASLLAVCLIVSSFPSYFPFYAASTLSFSLMWVSYNTFLKIEKAG